MFHSSSEFFYSLNKKYSHKHMIYIKKYNNQEMLHYTITFKKVLKRYKSKNLIHEQSNNDYFLYK